MATKTAKKATKKNVENIDFSNSIDKIKDTTDTVNTKVRETATEVMDDLRVNGEKLKDAAVQRVDQAIKTVKGAVEAIDLGKGVDRVKDAAKDINKYSLETADEIIDTTLKGAEEWQGVASKAVKGGLALAEKQQDIVFTTLEAVKEQLADGASRFRGLFRSRK